MSQDAALLITDLVDSVQLTRQLGDEAMSAVWTVHDRVARNLLAKWRGTEINRSDGFLLRFETVGDAASYVVAYHAALRGLASPLRARAGLHFGPVMVRDNVAADVEVGAKPSETAGLAVSMAGRIMALADAGQTLMTAEAQSALGATALRVVTHGFWRLKGVDEPVELFELGDDSAPFAPPGDSAKCYGVVRHGLLWLPRRDVPHSLAGERNPFVGRRDAMRDLAERLDGDHRLVTVFGTGGTGKTRFAQHFGWRYLGYFPGGAWFCDLSQATSFDGLCSAVAQGLRLPLGPHDPVEQIGAALAARGRSLVILDNFEQVTQHAAASVGRWLDRTVDAQFVVTSRNVLGIDGEELMALLPLEPHDAGVLFEMRARAANSRLALGADDRTGVAGLIDLLDGLPLAIELAAARMRLLTIDGLLERMRERFSLLAAGHGRPSRQATLKATFDWSWDLLDGAERAVLSQLSVFEGGFTLAAMRAVVDVPVEVRGGDGMQVLQSLVDQSWVHRIDDGRFGLLKSIQEYAALRLEEASSASTKERRLEAVRARHRRYFGSLDERAATASHCADLDNLIAATRHAIDANAGADAGMCLLSSWWALRRRGPFRVAVELGMVAWTVAADDLDKARVQYVIGNAWRHMGLLDRAGECLRNALASALASGAAQEECWILTAIGEQHANARQPAEAQSSFDEALRLARRIDDRRSQCAIVNALGTLLQETGRATESLPAYEDALALARGVGDSHLEGGVVGNLGGSLFALGRIDEARAHFERAIALSQASGNRRWEGNMRCNLGLCLVEQGDVRGAIGQLESALATARELGHLRLECTAAWNLALAYRASGDDDGALTYFTVASDVAAELGDRRSRATLLAEAAPLAAKVRGLASGEALFAEAQGLLIELDDGPGLASLQASRAKAASDAAITTAATDLSLSA